MVVTVVLETNLQWYDGRLLFWNPVTKHDHYITNVESVNVWTPLSELIHENATIEEITSAQGYDIKIVPIAPEAIDRSNAIENRIFNGSFNPLQLKERLKVKYGCIFDVRKFPFDHKTCEITMKIHQHKNIIYKHRTYELCIHCLTI